MMSRRRPLRRLTFVSVVAACWIVGLFGLDRNRMSSFQLPIVVGAGLAGYWMIGALRRRTEQSRERVVVPVPPEPRTCVVVRWLGEESQNVHRLPSVPAHEDVRRAQASHPSGKRRLNYIPLKGA